MSASFKIQDMIKRFLSALSAALLLVACNGSGDEPKEIKPVITLTDGGVEGNSLSFKVVVKNAFAAAYMCVPESDETPTSNTIFSKGRKFDVNSEANETVYNLAWNTTYNIVVAAMDEAGNIETATLAMTTAEQPLGLLLEATATTHKSFVFTLTPTNAEAVYYKMYKEGETATDADIIATGVSVSASEATTVTLDPAKGNYFVAALAKKGSEILRADDLTFSIAGAEVVSVDVKKVEAKTYDADILYDIYLQNSEINVIKIDCYFHEGSTSPYGEYSYSKDENPGVVAHSYSYTSFLNSSSRKFFTGGTVKVEDAGSGLYKITVNMTRDDEKVYDFTWTGAIQWK